MNSASNEQEGDGEIPTDAAGPAETDSTEFMTIHVRLGDGETVKCDAAPGLPLVDLLRASGIPIKAECGGAGVCATCHIHITGKWRDLMPDANDEELEKLDEIPGADDSSRLACQIEMTDDLDGLELQIQADSLALTKLEAAE